MLSNKAKRDLKINQRRILIESIEITIPSPQQILSWGEHELANGKKVGEVKNSKTVNYKKFTPLRDGLFCERIFGPINSFVCACGKRQSSPDSTFCEKCEVEYTDKRVRRTRLGYISLVSPVVHVWYLKGRPSYLSLFLGKRKKQMIALAYCNAYLVEQAFSNIDQSRHVSIKQDLTPQNTKKVTYFKDKGNSFYTPDKRSLSSSYLEKDEVAASHLASLSDPTPEGKKKSLLVSNLKNSESLQSLSKIRQLSNKFNRAKRIACDSALYEQDNKNYSATVLNALNLQDPDCYVKHNNHKNHIKNSNSNLIPAIQKALLPGTLCLSDLPDKRSFSSSCLEKEEVAASHLAKLSAPNPKNRELQNKKTDDFCNPNSSEHFLQLQNDLQTTKKLNRSRNNWVVDSFSHVFIDILKHTKNNFVLRSYGPSLPTLFVKKSENRQLHLIDFYFQRLTYCSFSLDKAIKAFPSTLSSFTNEEKSEASILQKDTFFLEAEGENFSKKKNFLKSRQQSCQTFQSKAKKYQITPQKIKDIIDFPKQEISIEDTEKSTLLKGVSLVNSKSVSFRKSKPILFSKKSFFNFSFPSYLWFRKKYLSKVKSTTKTKDDSNFRYFLTPFDSQKIKRKKAESSTSTTKQNELVANFEATESVVSDTFSSTETKNKDYSEDKKSLLKYFIFNSEKESFNDKNASLAKFDETVYKTNISPGHSTSEERVFSSSKTISENRENGEAGKKVKTETCLFLQAQTPQKQIKYYNRAQSVPFLPSLICKYNVREELVTFFNSSPLQSDIPLPFYCKINRWEALYDVHKFMAEQSLSSFSNNFYSKKMDKKVYQSGLEDSIFPNKNTLNLLDEKEPLLKINKSSFTKDYSALAPTKKKGGRSELNGWNFVNGFASPNKQSFSSFYKQNDEVAASPLAKLSDSTTFLNLSTKKKQNNKKIYPFINNTQLYNEKWFCFRNFESKNSNKYSILKALPLSKSIQVLKIYYLDFVLSNFMASSKISTLMPHIDDFDKRKNLIRAADFSSDSTLRSFEKEENKENTKEIFTLGNVLDLSCHFAWQKFNQTFDNKFLMSQNQNKTTETLALTETTSFLSKNAFKSLAHKQHILASYLRRSTKNAAFLKRNEAKMSPLKGSPKTKLKNLNFSILLAFQVASRMPKVFQSKKQDSREYTSSTDMLAFSKFASEKTFLPTTKVSFDFALQNLLAMLSSFAPQNDAKERVTNATSSFCSVLDHLALLSEKSKTRQNEDKLRMSKDSLQESDQLHKEKEFLLKKSPSSQVLNNFSQSKALDTFYLSHLSKLSENKRKINSKLVTSLLTFSRTFTNPSTYFRLYSLIYAFEKRLLHNVYNSRQQSCQTLSIKKQKSDPDKQNDDSKAVRLCGAKQDNTPLSLFLIVPALKAATSYKTNNVISRALQKFTAGKLNSTAFKTIETENKSSKSITNPTFEAFCQQKVENSFISSERFFPSEKLLGASDKDNPDKRSSSSFCNQNDEAAVAKQNSNLYMFLETRGISSAFTMSILATNQSKDYQKAASKTVGNIKHKSTLSKSFTFTKSNKLDLSKNYLTISNLQIQEHKEEELPAYDAFSSFPGVVQKHSLIRNNQNTKQEKRLKTRSEKDGELLYGNQNPFSRNEISQFVLSKSVLFATLTVNKTNKTSEKERVNGQKSSLDFQTGKVSSFCKQNDAFAGQSNSFILPENQNDELAIFPLAKVSDPTSFSKESNNGERLLSKDFTGSDQPSQKDTSKGESILPLQDQYNDANQEKTKTKNNKPVLNSLEALEVVGDEKLLSDSYTTTPSLENTDVTFDQGMQLSKQEFSMPGQNPGKQSEMLSHLELSTIREILSYTGGGALEAYLKRIDVISFFNFLSADITITRAIYKEKRTRIGHGTQVNRKQRRVLTRLAKRLSLSSRRLKIIQLFMRNKRRPEWMMISVLPVLPPDLRPILQMSENVVVASDINNLYQRVIYRNNRFHKLGFIDSHLVTAIQRLVQDAVDRLIENGKGTSKPFYTPAGRPLKSLSDTLKGKKGRFRYNLLGKRVDFSGRSVIVVSPQLKIQECGLPKEIALELFHYFLLRQLLLKKQASSIVLAKKQIKERKPVIWDMLRDIIYHHPVLLNRAPTLHRLGIQAFQPKLIDGNAIWLHPLVCSAFNADFDGDQMGVHLPLSIQARAEAWDLLWSRNNLLSPATGQPVLVPSQDMVLGFYYMTQSFASPIALRSKETVKRFPIVKRHLPKDLPFASKTMTAKVSSFCVVLQSKTEQNDDFAEQSNKLPVALPSKTTAKNFELQEKPFDGRSTRVLDVRQLEASKQLFFDTFTLLNAFQSGHITLHTPVWLALNYNESFEHDKAALVPLELRVNVFANSTYIYSEYKRRKDETTSQITSYIRTTAGKVLVNKFL